MGRRTINATAKGWGVQLEFSKDFLGYSCNKGYLLGYLAENVISIINERTDRQLDVNGQPFTRYKERYTLEREDGKILRARDGKGRWKKVRGPEDPVTLRSPFDIPENQRMRSSLDYAPRIINPETQQVTVKPVRGRKGVSHMLRAKVASGFMGKSPIRRQFIGLSPNEWSKLLNGIQREGVLEFIAKNKKEWHNQQKDRAKRNIKRLRARAKSKEKAAKLSAESRHKAYVKKLERLGLKPEDTSKEAYKAASRQRRTQRATRRATAQARRKGREFSNL